MNATITSRITESAVTEAVIAESKAALSPYAKFLKTREELNDSLIERSEEIDLALVALLAQEHVLFVGPPGTAKSMLSDAICSWMHGERFQVLLSKFSTPEEVFGPISVVGLKSDQYRRIVSGKLPEAHVAFVDEIFKASTAILNTLLQVLNERTYRNDGALLKCPLKLCVAASNEWPGDQDGGKELGALFDRFLFRKLVRPIATERNIYQLMFGGEVLPKLSTTITPKELDSASIAAQRQPWSQAAKDAFMEIRREAKNEGIVPGDRRLKKAVKAASCYAFLEGGAMVEPDHLSILSHVLWDDPQEQPKKLAEIVGKIANPSGMAVNSLLMEAEQIILTLDPKDLAKASSATKKLQAIHKSLSEIGTAKAREAASYVNEKVSDFKKSIVHAL